MYDSGIRWRGSGLKRSDVRVQASQIVLNWVPVKVVDKLAAAMLRFIEEPELAVCMGGRSRQSSKKKYDVHQVNAVMLRKIEL